MSIKQYFQLILVLLTFCTFTSVPAWSETKQLNWIGHWKGEDKREDLVNEVKKEFEFLHPEVQLNFLYNREIDAQGDNYKWKNAYTIVEMIQTGNIKWDVIFLDVFVYDHVAELLNDPFWGSKHLVNFSNVPGFLQTQKDFLVEDPFYRNKMGGIFTGPFIEGFFYCFWYNIDVAEKVGINILERKMKIDDLLIFAKQLSEYNQKNNTSIPLIRMSTWNRLDSLFEHLFKSQFDDPKFAIDQSFNTRKEKAFRDTLLFFEQLSQFQPILNNDRKTLGWAEWKQGFLENKGLFAAGGTFFYSHFKATGSENYNKVRPAEYPVVKKTNGLVGIYTPVFAVMKNSPNKKAALDLLLLWSEPKIAEKWVTYTRNPTGIKGSMNDPALRTLMELKEDIYGKFLEDMMEQYSELPMRHFQQPLYVFGKKNPVSSSEFRENLALILEGKKTAEEYYNDIMMRYRQQ